MTPSIAESEAIVNDKAKPIDERYKALHALLDTHDGKYVHDMVKAMHDPSDLFSHEAAYCLGQLQNKEAIKDLLTVLNDEKRAVIVRHEAGEALGAIGHHDEDVIKALKHHEHHEAIPIKETCELALARLNFLLKHSKTSPEHYKSAKYVVVDPAIPSSCEDIKELESMLLNNELNLVERYGAMIALRNIGTDEAVEILCKGLAHSNSALHRHQIAFLLGELGNPKAADALLARANDHKEHQIVRHESIQALGCMGKHLDEVKSKHANDPDPVIAETVKVAMTAKTNGGSYLHPIRA